MSDKIKVLAHFQRAIYSDCILDFEDVLSDAVRTALQKTEIETEAYLSQRTISKHWNEMLQQMDEDLKRGLLPTFIIKDETLKKIVWFPAYREANESNKETFLKILSASRPYFMRVIDQIDDRDYEALACLLCKLLGANNICLTPPGNEGGIDFIATIKFPQSSHFFLDVKGPIRIIGQCKQYSSKVSVDKIRDFITTINDVKHQSPTVEHLIPSWFRIEKGPILGWMIAHSGFQSGTISTAQNHGIILSDTRDIVELMALSRKYHTYDSPQERANMIKPHIQQILAQAY